MSDVEKQSDELSWQAMRYVSGEMSESEAATFEELLSSDEAACEAVSRAVQLSFVVRDAFETEPAKTVELPEKPETVASKVLAVRSLPPMAARWMSLATAIAAVAAVLMVASSVENGTEVAVVTNSGTEASELVDLWTQAADVLPQETPAATTGDERIVQTDESPIDAVDLVDVPDWLLVALETQQRGDEDEILEN